MANCGGDEEFAYMFIGFTLSIYFETKLVLYLFLHYNSKISLKKEKVKLHIFFASGHLLVHKIFHLKEDERVCMLIKICCARGLIPQGCVFLAMTSVRVAK